MFIKGKGLIKLCLLIFIAVAVYAGRKDFFDKLSAKTKNIISQDGEVLKQNDIQNSAKAQSSNKKDPETLGFKFGAKDDKSVVGKFVSSSLNKLLETPKGRDVVKGVLQKMVNRSQTITMQDLFLSRYLTHDIIVGTGKEAVCGDKVTILYELAASKKKNIPKTKLKKEIIIGDGVLGINLENGIIGMKKSGKRNIVYPNIQATAQQTETTRSAVIQLLAIKNNNGFHGNLGKPFFDKIGEEYFDSIKLICGDIVKGSYVLSDLKGNILYDSKKAAKDFSFKIGEAKIPRELSNAIMGLSIHKASVSFIDSVAGIQDSFSKINDFIPKDISAKKIRYPIILKFNLVLHDKV